MKRELVIIAITAFAIANTYSEGKYIDIMRGWKKYYTMVGYAFAGLSAILYLRKFGTSNRDILSDAADLVKHIPIDTDAADMISPMMGFAKETMGWNKRGVERDSSVGYERRMMNSGNNGQKRSVGETKKKYVAANQGWKCAKCSNQLSAWFEVDHKLSLEHGGTNEVSNLEALCRECHGEKTAMSRFM
jgi:5-methylcytosine-specific restriction endonuclease McrA